MNTHRIADTTTDGHPTIALISTSAGVEATFVPSLGMIACSLRHRGAELLGQRGGLAKYAASGSTMGIPLLYPWANRLSGFTYAAAGRRVTLDPESPLLHRDANGLPMHGLLGAWPGWKIVDRVADERGAALRAVLDFAADAALSAAFPFPHELGIDVTLRDSTLTIATCVRASDVPVPISFGYHPYFQLPGVPRAEWYVELPVHRRLLVDERTIPTGAREPVAIAPGPLGDRGFDTLYTDLASPPRFVLAGGGRRVTVEFGDGYPYAQVYALTNGSFICFEPMTAPIDALVSGDGLRLVEPRQEFRAVFSITID